MMKQVEDVVTKEPSLAFTAGRWTEPYEIILKNAKKF